MIKKSKRIKIIEELKKNTNNAPDINYKDFEFNDEAITFIYSMSVSSSNDINHFILRSIDEVKDKIKSDALSHQIYKLCLLREPRCLPQLTSLSKSCVTMLVINQKL